MNRLLSCFNLLGVGALAILCAVQWRANSRINLKAIELERIRIEQMGTIGDQQKLLKNNSVELDDLHDRLERAGVAIKEDEAKLAAGALERKQLTAQRDQLITTLNEWRAAVAERDKTIRTAADEIQKLAASRNEAVGKFNDLAEKYNGVVKDLNEARAKLAAGR
jgi:DNA repair exonuclease SbcCD ATPase subunit